MKQKGENVDSSKYLIILWLLLSHCLVTHTQHNNGLCRAASKDILYLSALLKSPHSNNGPSSHNETLKWVSNKGLCVSHTFSVPLPVSGTAWQNYKMDFTVTYEQLNYYIIRHHRSFAMLDLITCLWGRRGILRTSSYTGFYYGIRNPETEEGSSYESFRENIQSCGPCFKCHSTRQKNAECLLIFHDIFQNKQMPKSGDHLRWRGCFEDISWYAWECLFVPTLVD